MSLTWLSMALEVAAFLALSAVMFFVVTRAGTEPEVSDPDRVAPVTMTDATITTPGRPLRGELAGPGRIQAPGRRAA